MFAIKCRLLELLKVWKDVKDKIVPLYATPLTKMTQSQSPCLSRNAIWEVTIYAEDFGISVYIDSDLFHPLWETDKEK